MPNGGHPGLREDRPSLPATNSLVSAGAYIRSILRPAEVLGYKAYPTVSSIPEPIDLVIVAVPARALPAVLEDCIKADARNIHAFTSGFEETGEEEAIALGLKVREIAERGRLRLIGPNCMGLYVPSAGIGTFDQLPKEERFGGLPLPERGPLQLVRPLWPELRGQLQ